MALPKKIRNSGLGFPPTAIFPIFPGPLQLHHGTADTSVPVEFSQTLYEKGLNAGMPVEYYEYPDDDHNLAGNFSLAMARTLEFFDRYLKNPD